MISRYYVRFVFGNPENEVCMMYEKDDEYQISGLKTVPTTLIKIIALFKIRIEATGLLNIFRQLFCTREHSRLTKRRHELN